MKKVYSHSAFQLSLLLIASYFLSFYFVPDNEDLPVQSRFDSATDLNSLAANFISPPDNTRAWVYWYVMDGNLTREGITADLEAMKRVGIGGAILLEVDQNMPLGKTLMMSQDWIDHFKFINEEATRLGIEITLNSGPGWTGSGGPWIKPEDAMHFIVADTISVRGGGIVTVQLPQAKPVKPYYISWGYKLTPEMDTIRKYYYTDLFTFAYPKPGNGLSAIPEIAAKAMYTPDGFTMAPYIISPAGTTLEQDKYIDISKYVGSDGFLNWDAPEGEWLVYRFGQTLTGQPTIPAPKSAYGFECSKFDTSGLNRHFDAYLAPLIKATGMTQGEHKTGWNSLHIDSWEMCTQNWSKDFAEQFKKRRGYEVFPYLAVLTGTVVGSSEISERFLFDYRLTGQELVLENHVQHLKNIGDQYGFSFSNENYGFLTVNSVAYGAIADIPMCEFWNDTYEMSFSVLQATSAAHINNKPVVGAESFTSVAGALNPDTISWRMNPGNMKNQADWAFCRGINRLVFHTYVFQPWLDKFPGMTMGGIGIHYERTQTWWELSGAWHDYLARSQYMLRQGQPVVDILYLMKEGAPERFAPPADALFGTTSMPYPKGYNFDGCDPGSLINKANVSNGKICFPGGMEYSILVMPNTETMSPGLLRKIKSLIEEGATVVGFAPQKSTGLYNYPDCDAEVASLADSIWKNLLHTAGTKSIGKGKLITPSVPVNPEGGYNQLYTSYETVSHILSGMAIQPDFESNIPLRYIHRRTGNFDIFMISNPGHKTVRARCVFRVENKKASLWNAVNAEIATAIVTSTADGRSEIDLSFEADGSVFVVFSNDDSKPVVNTNSLWTKLHEESVLQGPWLVKFQKNRGAPETETFKNLIDWSTHTTFGIKYFSGIAEYSNTFQLPVETLKGQNKIYIDLGRVAVMASVIVNDSLIAQLWKAPFVCDITRYVKAGTNSIKIAVANEWPNRMVGDIFVMPRNKIAFSTFSNFVINQKLLPSGLIGPVRILRSDPYVSFTLVNTRTLEKLPGVNVSFGSETRVSDVNGNVGFLTESGTIGFTINNASYKVETGIVNIDTDTSLVIYLEQLSAYTKFQLKEGVTPVNNAVIVLNSDSLVTNAIGIAQFNELLLDSLYRYSITKTGYYTLSGEFYLGRDTLIDLEMEMNNIGIKDPPGNGQFKIWPNPASGFLHFSYPSNYINSTFIITDLLGNKLYTASVNEPGFTLSLKDFQPGAYIFKLIQDPDYSRVFVVSK